MVWLGLSLRRAKVTSAAPRICLDSAMSASERRIFSVEYTTLSWPVLVMCAVASQSSVVTVSS